MQPLKAVLRVMLMCAVIISCAFTSKLSSGTADSLVFQNDSTFTIEGVQQELQSEGEWINITKDEIDPEAVADVSGGIDDEINTNYVWRPTNVEEGWSPYTNGYWVYTNCGWSWVSYYRWGWRTCHYGRWWWSSQWGWVWSPGFVYAPAWVVWMYNDGYCGWYPISPWVRYHHGYHGWRCHNMRYRTRCWTIVEKRHFADPITPRVPIVDPFHNPGVIHDPNMDVDPTLSTTGVNNNGPKVKNIEDATGKKIAVNDVGMYNNTGKYIDTKNDVKNNDKKIDIRTNTNDKDKEVWYKNNDNGNNTGRNDGGNNNVGKKDDGNNSVGKNDGGNNSVGKKNDGNNNTGRNDGGNNNTGKKDNGNNNTGKNDNGNKNNNGKKQYNPPPKQDPPKQYDPPKQEKPKKEQPKQDPPKNDNGNRNKSNDSWKESPPTKQDDGSKGKK